MNAILDVSAAYAIVTGGSGAESYSQIIATAKRVMAPDIYYSEASNAAWKYFHIEDAPVEIVFKLSIQAVSLIDHFLPSNSLWQDALKLACDLEHPVYDCFYLVLAQKFEATLLTSDRKLLKKATKIGVKTIGPAK